MDCSCRTIALRTFVRGITQVHAPPRAAAPLGARYQAHLHAAHASPPSSLPNQRTPSGPAIAAQAFHTSCARDHPPQPAGVEGWRARKHLDDLAAPETGSAGSERSAGRPFKTKKRRTDKATEEKQGLTWQEKAWEQAGRKDGMTWPEAKAFWAEQKGKFEDDEGVQPMTRKEQRSLIAREAERHRSANRSALRKGAQAEQAASDSDKKGMEKEGMAKKRRDLEIKRVYGAPSDADEPKPKKGRDPKARRAGPAAGDEDEPKPKEEWKIQKEALKKKFPEGWKPRKKLSPDAMAGIRMLHEQFPDEYTTPALANKFEVSPEAIRRILKSDWRPKADEEADRDERWFKRGKSVWTQWAALGKKPPRKWRAEGIVRDPVWNKPRGPTHKKKDERAEAQRRLAWAMKGMEPPPRPAKTSTASPA